MDNGYVDLGEIHPDMKWIEKTHLNGTVWTLTKLLAEVLWERPVVYLRDPRNELTDKILARLVKDLRLPFINHYAEESDYSLEAEDDDQHALLIQYVRIFEKAKISMKKSVGRDSSVSYAFMMTPTFEDVERKMSSTRR